MTPPAVAARAPLWASWPDASRLAQNGLVLALVLALAVAVVLPLWALLSKSVQNGAGEFVGLANFIRYFETPSLSSSLSNSLFISVVTTLVSVSCGFVYAYALTRAAIPGKGVFLGLAMAPLFAPTLLNGIALVYLFGKKGLVTTGFLGLDKALLGLDLGLDIGLYGATGIILAEVVYTFPQAVLILSVALRLADARLYEAAASLGASGTRTFFTVTLPGVKYGLLSAVFVCFILCFTDFGAPKVLGGSTNVLATDIYKQVIGQQNFSMGATVSVILLLPTLLAFVADRLAARRQAAMISARSAPLRPAPNPWRDRLLFGFCLLVAGAIATLFATALFASLVRVWPYNLDMTLAHYDFSRAGGGGYAALWNSLRMSLYSAAIGAAAAFGAAYLVGKGRGLALFRQAAHLLCMTPLALPGLVVGLAYIFFFNAPTLRLPGLELKNPFIGIYGTMGILVLANVTHFLTVSYLTAATALSQLDPEFETVSESLGAPARRVFFRVAVPVCLPAILDIALYLFVNSMATISAVIFLYASDLPIASVAVANMDDAGDIAPACAMSMCIVATCVLARLGFGLATGGTARRARAWLGRDGD